MIFNDSYSVFEGFDTACNVQSESLATALITQTVELRKRPEAPDLRIDGSCNVFRWF